MLCVILVLLRSLAPDLLACGMIEFRELPVDQLVFAGLGHRTRIEVRQTLTAERT
jgi:hypothetical protein